MRPPAVFVRPVALLAALCGVLATGCGTPAMAVPLAMSQMPPTSLSVPTEDGSHYVLVEAGSRTPISSLPRLWKKKATSTCKGDYIVLSEGANEKKTGGVLSGASYEGWVRCISPEVSDEESEQVAEELDASA